MDQAKLEEALEFSAADLASNQRGELSEAQIVRFAAIDRSLSHNHHATRLVAGWISIVCLLASLPCLVAALLGAPELVTAAAILGSLSAMAFVAWLSLQGPPVAVGVPVPHRVLMAEGLVVHRVRDTDGWTEQPGVFVGEMEFRISFAVAAALEEYARYRVYYLDVFRAPLLLSAERLRHD